MKIAVLIARVLLGLIFLVFGLNFFFHFINMAQPVMSLAAAKFQAGLWGSGYFFKYLKVIESVSGLFLLLNRYTALFLVILFPISVNIFLYHAILVPPGIPLGTVIIVLNLFLAFAYRKYYSGIFTAKPVV
jgi:putative oxidoreductase